jgi:hypothetical protein
MKTDKIRWRLKQGDIDRLSASLKPIRTCREVAGILGVSVAQVCQLESSALGKIIRAVNEYEQNGKYKQNGGSNHE